LGDALAPPELFWRAAANPALAPRSSSVGRLFDAVAALALDCRTSACEGHPAMLLEAACDRSSEGSYELPLRRDESGEPAELDWRPLIRGIAEDLARGAAPGAVAVRFHRGLAAAVATVAGSWPELPVVLGGGVFQNRVLTELVAGLLADRELALPGVIPPGDGGLAAGQLAVALARAEAPGSRHSPSADSHGA
jgi:hydrogenase maturation protein HypF